MLPRAELNVRVQMNGEKHSTEKYEADWFKVNIWLANIWHNQKLWKENPFIRDWQELIGSQPIDSLLLFDLQTTGMPNIGI